MKTQYIINLKIKEDEYEILSSDINIEHHVELNISNEDVPEFYSDTKEFMENHVSFSMEKAVKRLYLITTNQSGWDTYDSAVYCAYTEFEAAELSQDKMGHEYSNNAECIGLANEDLEIGEVCSSFNAG